MRILVAEDDPVSLRILARVLERNGHSVTHAADGQRALAALYQAGPFDAIITDWMMPRLDGISFIRAARQQFEELPPIIVLTAIASDEARESVLEAGADDYLAKPVQPAELLQCLERCLARYSQVSSRPEGLKITGLASVIGRPLVTVVAGAGGPVAIQQLFRKLTGAATASFLVVQHGPHWMLETFVHKLQTQTSLRVAMAAPGSRLDAGTVLIAPGGQHSTVAPDGTLVMLTETAPENFLRPSGDVLLRSMVGFGRCCAAVIMSGLGCDGAAGAAQLMAAGGRVLIQSPSSADVASMPRAALALCAEAGSTPLGELPGQLDSWIASVQVPGVRGTARVSTNLDHRG
jgi:two-component system, chemotaxis family, protein-glutamate methylesterase/glutaminase